MDAPPPELELEPEVGPVDGARARRAIALIAVSLVVIAAAGVAYLHPSISIGVASHPALPAAPPQSGYMLAAVDFVDSKTGWVTAVFDDGDFLVMKTADAGAHWTPQLSGPTDGHGVFMKFFDTLDGVFALTGTRPLLYHTADGGSSWSAEPAVTARATVLAWSFSDSANGWMLVHVDPQVADDTHLYRTSDAGGTWSDQGLPVRLPDQAYSVAFARGGTGWLATLSSGPYAYRSDDYGVSWSRVALPAERGWPQGGQFLVSAQPVGTIGVVASVVAFAPTTGRSGIGASILDYPPLKVRAFDGGVPVTYVYGVASEGMPFQPTGLQGWNPAQVEAPNQAQLLSPDDGADWTPISLPTAPGAIGVLDTWHWWWIGLGSWSVTSDGGRTWSSPRNIVVPQPMAGSLQILDAMHAWYAAMIGSRPVLVSTDDGGVTWRTTSLPPMSSRFTP